MSNFPMIRKFVKLIVITSLIPSVLLIRFLRIWILIRFGNIRSERIGHFAMNTEMHCCEKDLSIEKSAGNIRAFDIYHCNKVVCNYQLLKMWKRVLRIWQFARFIDKANRLLPGHEKHTIRVHSSRDPDGLLRKTSPHLSFTPEEEENGRRGLAALGVDPKFPIACIYGRDSAYLNAVSPGNNWAYHDYRDTKISNFIPAALDLVHRGYHVLRVGHFVKEKFNVEHPMICDYANLNRSDFMDMYICATCQLFVGVSGGIVSVPMIFRRPIVYVNHIPLENIHAWDSNAICIPKKIWSHKEGRMLTFREILLSGAGRFMTSQEYQRMELEPVENTSEEIAAAAKEMDDRLKGKWVTSEEDEGLQRKFWGFFKPSEKNRVFVSRIGTEFLRQNQTLLN